MSFTISKVHFNTSHIFRGVLQNWIKANILCAEAWKDDDVPWWYNERANLSILAAAAWKKGEIAFEEFTVEKRRKRRKKLQSTPYLGRQDIYMKIGNQEFIGEAKMCWSGATSKNRNPATNINVSMKCACDDIRKSLPYKQKRLGIVFAVPMIKKSGHKLVDQCIKNWVRKIKKVDCSCHAWVFPEVSRKTKHENVIYPGVAVFIREI